MRRIAFLYDYRSTRGMVEWTSAEILSANIVTMAKSMTAAGYSADIYMQMSGLKQVYTVHCLPHIQVIYVPEKKIFTAGPEFCAASIAHDILEYIFLNQLIYE